MSTRRTSPPTTRGEATRLVTARKHNLRQLLLHASRILNAEIVEALIGRGYDLKSTHTALLSNLDEQGDTLSRVADRAGMSKQAMGRLADELEALHYVVSVSDAHDRRARVLKFTPKGWKLMLASFDALADIEHRYARRIGRARLDGLCTTLEDLLETADGEPR